MTLYSLFLKYDENQDEALNENELTNLFKNDFGLTTDEAEIYLYLLDDNGDGKISFEEFKKWFDSDENLKCIHDDSRFTIIRSAIELFKRFDTDRNFSLDRDELRNVIQEFGGNPDTVGTAFEQLDVDHDGRISFREFLRWLNWIPMDTLF